MSMMRIILSLAAVLSILLPYTSCGGVRTFRYGFNVENPTGQVVEQAQLWTYAPIEHTAYQECLSLSASHPYAIDVDSLGNRILCFTFPKVAPYQQIQVRIEASLDMRDEPRGTPGDDGIGRAGGRLFEVDAETWDRLAPAFPTGDSLHCVRQIYGWTSAHLRYAGYQARDRGAGFALEKRTGDCTEYMSLMAAACLRHQIPVRGIAGFVTGQSGWLGPEELHNWTEVMLEGNWWVVDPLKQQFLQDGGDHVALYRVGESDNAMNGFARFRIDGEGLRVRMDTHRR